MAIIVVSRLNLVRDYAFCIKDSISNIFLTSNLLSWPHNICIYGTHRKIKFMMKLKIWGSRGSIPSPLTPREVEQKVINNLQDFCNSPYFADKNLAQFLSTRTLAFKSTFGGNTTCVEISHDTQSLIIDGGSGLRLKGIELMAGDCGKGKGEVHIYQTHFHWDHLMGIPFFIPLFVPGNNIHFYSVDPKLEEAIKLIFTKPYFPVPFTALGAKVHFHQLKPREKNIINGLEVTPYLLDHPDPCWGAKVSDGKKNYAHVVDNEGKRVKEAALGADFPLYQNIDLMYFDAQYGFSDMLKRVDWGHSSSFIGMDMAFREKIKKVIFTHHDPMASDLDLNRMLESNVAYYQSQISQQDHRFQWEFAYDGMEAEV
jgi:phosphoribosyl 1,2-cyclic phosphodiesterase